MTLLWSSSCSLSFIFKLALDSLSTLSQLSLRTLSLGWLLWVLNIFGLSSFWELSELYSQRVVVYLRHCLVCSPASERCSIFTVYCTAVLYFTSCAKIYDWILWNNMKCLPAAHVLPYVKGQYWYSIKALLKSSFHQTPIIWCIVAKSFISIRI